LKKKKKKKKLMIKEMLKISQMLEEEEQEEAHCSCDDGLAHMINSNVLKCLNSHPLLLPISYKKLVEIQHEVGQ
jgi:hypothetical protein